MSFLGLKKRCDLLFRPQEKRSRNSPFDWKPCGPWSSLGHLSILLPCLLMLLIVLLYLLSGFSYCSCSTLVIILLMMMSWIWLDGDHSLHFHFVTNSHVERLVAHSRLFDSKWELFLNSIPWLLDARKIHCLLWKVLVKKYSKQRLSRETFGANLNEWNFWDC